MNTCAPHATPLRTITRAICVFGGINFGDLENSPICQIKISNYTVSLTKLCVYSLTQAASYVL